MAKDQFSFDVVSEVSMPEVTNAVDQAAREIGQRFDFKNTGTNISQDATTIELRSSTEDRLKAALDVLKDRAVKRGISLKALREGPVQPAAKGTYRQNVNVTTGISEEKAKAIVKLVKASGLKVQSQIQGEQVRITGKKKDDLQAVIAVLKEQDLELPLQFTNFRP
jgi:cyclic-di-GMP-binding protein